MQMQSSVDVLKNYLSTVTGQVEQLVASECRPDDGELENYIKVVIAQITKLSRGARTKVVDQIAEPWDGLWDIKVNEPLAPPSTESFLGAMRKLDRLQLYDAVIFEGYGMEKEGKKVYMPLTEASTSCGSFDETESFVDEEEYEEESIPAVTTLMVKNIPAKYTQTMLLDEICERGFSGRYDFFYMPANHKTRANHGYAFINLLTEGDVFDFRNEFESKKLNRYQNKKVIDIAPATLQGIPSLYEHYAHKVVTTDECSDFRPIFLQDGMPLQLAPKTDDSTTLMIKNVTSHYTQASFLLEIDEAGFEGTYDLFYLPIDPVTEENVGHAFINFRSVEYAIAFRKYLDGRKLSMSKRRIATVCSARFQGFEQSAKELMDLALSYSALDWYPERSPLLFWEDGSFQMLADYCRGNLTEESPKPIELPEYDYVPLPVMITLPESVTAGSQVVIQGQLYNVLPMPADLLSSSESAIEAA